jgi:hypothetical protein
MLYVFRRTAITQAFLVAILVKRDAAARRMVQNQTAGEAAIIQTAAETRSLRRPRFLSCSF